MESNGLTFHLRRWERRRGFGRIERKLYCFMRLTGGLNDMHHKNVFEDIFQKLILAYAIRHGETPNYFYTSYKIMNMEGWDIEVVDGKFRDIKILYTKKAGLAVFMEEVSVDKIDEDL